jgi:hypothetical protein
MPMRSLRVPLAWGGDRVPHQYKNVRHRITDLFLALLYESFFEGGKAAIERVRDEKPADYLKLIMMLIPKQITGEDGEAIRVELSGGVAMLEQKLKAIAARETAITIDEEECDEKRQMASEQYDA